MPCKQVLKISLFTTSKDDYPNCVLGSFGLAFHKIQGVAAKHSKELRGLAISIFCRLDQFIIISIYLYFSVVG